MGTSESLKLKEIADRQGSREGADRRASNESVHSVNHPPYFSPPLQPGSSRRSIPDQYILPSQTYQQHPHPINTSMPDARFAPMSAPASFNPFYPHHESPIVPDTGDEYDEIAHHRLVSRAPDPSMLVSQANWAAMSSGAFAPAIYSLPGFGWQVPFAHGQQSVAPAPISPPGSAISPFASTISPPFQPANFNMMQSMAASTGAMQPPFVVTSMSSEKPTESPASSVSISSESIQSKSSYGTAPPGSAGSGPMRIKPNKRSKEEAKSKIQKSEKASARPARGGALTTTGKPKADLVRDLGACWRCRRYKKSCDGPGECTNCQRGHFRVWPSSLGCRRGCLDELVSHLVPVRASEILPPASRATFRRPNWRYGEVSHALQRMVDAQLPTADNWARLSIKVQSTGMYGQEFASLLDILAKYQGSLSRPNALLEMAVSLLDSTCDIYQNFVSSAWPSDTPPDLHGAIVTAQRAYAGVSRMFLTSALSGRRRDWLPSFLSMCIAFCAVMIMMDAALAVPPQFQAELWGSVYQVSRDLRQRLYPVTRDLLRASSNGSKPFALGCWSVDEKLDDSTGTIELVRSPEGMRMLGGDKAAFDGMRGLQEWIRRNIRLMDLGNKVIKSDPFSTPEVPAIAAVLKLFDL